MSSVDVKGTLENYVKAGGLAVTSDIGDQFGASIGTAITQLFGGSISLGEGFSLTGDANSATIIGTGAAAPLLTSVKVTAVFADSSGDVGQVELTFNASILSDITLADAWPTLLNSYPFTEVVLTSGTMVLTVNPGDSSYKLKLSPAITFEGETLSSTGLLELQYANSELGFLGGAVVAGSWTPFKDIPVLSSLTLTGELGAFFSTITETNLKDFSTFPFVPEQITPGLTVFSELAMGGTIAKIASFIANNATLQLTAIVPLEGGLSQASVSAAIANSTTTGDFDVSDFSLTWQSTSADSGTITLHVEAVINISTQTSAKQALDVIGDGSFVYGPSPALDLKLELTANSGKGWVSPFGIPNLTVVEIELDLSLNPEAAGIIIALGGTIDIGSGDDAVALTVGAALDDFEVPTFFDAALSSVDQGKLVSLATLLDDFLPELDASKFPLLDNIQFGGLSFYACAAPQNFEGKSYQPGIGLTGDIDFYGYDLDFAFSLITLPQVAVQAKGSLSYKGGPIVISGGGIDWITIKGTNGMSYPSACIDTTGSGYCTCAGGITNAYFCFEGSLSILGLATISVTAAATAELFELDVDLSTSSHILSEKLHIFLDLTSSVFAASSDFDFSPPSIVLGPWGVIPQFSIPTPQISICLALGTVVPTSAPCADQWMPTSAPYFRFDLKFSWGALDFDLNFTVDINAVVNAFNDFGQFILNWLLQQAEDVLGWIVEIGDLIAKALLQLGQEIADVAKAIAKQLEIAFDDAYKIASDAWDELKALCAVNTGDNAMSAASSSLQGSRIVSPITPVPSVLAHLAAAPKGQELLTHYYLHRNEADHLMRSDASVIERSRQQINAHHASPDYKKDIHLPLVLDLVAITASAASEEYKASAGKVLEILTPYREKTYEELLEVLNEA